MLDINPNSYQQITDVLDLLAGVSVAPEIIGNARLEGMHRTFVNFARPFAQKKFILIFQESIRNPRILVPTFLGFVVLGAALHFFWKPIPHFSEAIWVLDEILLLFMAGSLLISVLVFIVPYTIIVLAHWGVPGTRFLAGRLLPKVFSSNPNPSYFVAILFGVPILCVGLIIAYYPEALSFLHLRPRTWPIVASVPTSIVVLYVAWIWLVLLLVFVGEKLLDGILTALVWITTRTEFSRFLLIIGFLLFLSSGVIKVLT